MGELFRISNKIVIKIWSNDHAPAHVHVLVRSEMIHFKVYVETLEVEHVSRKQLSASDEKMIVDFVGKHAEFIMEEWNGTQKNK